MRFKNVKAIYPPPGNDIILPDWKVEKFFETIGFGREEYADKFESL